MQNFIRLNFSTKVNHKHDECALARNIKKEVYVVLVNAMFTG